MKKILKKYGHIVFSLFVGLMSTSCTSPNVKLSQNLAIAKKDFQQKDYSRSFKRLILLAQKGDFEAQYAVGYDYYYGLGVVEDKQQAIYWMTQAAQNGSVKARQALAKIPADNNSLSDIDISHGS